MCIYIYIYIIYIYYIYIYYIYMYIYIYIYAQTQTHINISRKDIEVIFHCRTSLLFHNNESWIKSDGNDDFDVTMGSYGGA